jgi:uncharacterized protein (TIGR02246 family)
MTTAPVAPLEALIDDYSAAWASHDPDRIAAFHAEDGVFQLHSGDAGPVRGRAAIRDAFAGFLSEYPDLEFVEQELHSAEWGWAVRWTMNAGSISIDAVDVITVSDGLIAAKHTYLDWAAGLEQMGLS